MMYDTCIYMPPFHIGHHPAVVAYSLLMKLPDTLTTIPYVDHPELKFTEQESTEMPFRYVTDKDGKPIMPEVC
jgi:ribosome biogenesis SPOUT family RNA methylase Rps3